jgi:hypothetical protein
MLKNKKKKKMSSYMKVLSTAPIKGLSSEGTSKKMKQEKPKSIFGR